MLIKKHVLGEVNEWMDGWMGEGSKYGLKDCLRSSKYRLTEHNL